MSFVSRIKDEENFIKEFNELSIKYKTVDLSLGYPNYLPPEFVTNALSEVLNANNVDDHQYTNPNGHPKFIEILDKMYSKLLKREINPNEEILVTAGSSEALFCAILSTVSPGDEVIIIEPYFSVFVTLVKLAGGIPKFLSLKLNANADDNPTSDSWTFDEQQLEELFNEKTKTIIVNTPHNPTGKVFTMEELKFIANLCIKWNITCIADEVYERMVFKPKTHIRIASLPGMFERTVTLGAAEKSFGVTGWQIGYAYGAKDLIKSMQILHQHAVFNASTPLQVAFADMFETEYNKMNQPNCYFKNLEIQLKEKRDFVVDILKKCNFEPIVPDGGMFVLADISKLVYLIDRNEEPGEFADQNFVKYLIKYHGLQAFPVTVFCSDENKKNYANYVRFCFVKAHSTLEQAANKLNSFRGVHYKEY